jgi:hypothetical protein
MSQPIIHEFLREEIIMLSPDSWGTVGFHGVGAV